MRAQLERTHHEALEPRHPPRLRASVAVDAMSPAVDACAVPPPPSVAGVDDDLVALQADPELAAMFVAESLDHLATIEAALLELDANPADGRLLDDLFRPFHTLKGNASALGIRAVQDVAHRVESLLDLCRSGRRRAGPAEVDVVLQSVDVLTAMFIGLRDRLSGRPARDNEAGRQRLLAAIDRLITGAAGPEAAPSAVNGEVRGQLRRRDDGAAVKVDTRKLDGLIDIAGDLAALQGRLQEQLGESAGTDQLTRDLAQLRRLTSELQRTAMSMRMVPIRQTFRKMARLVRETGRSSGKSVELVVEGEDTELDRKVVEAINDPLMHMLRNSIDHGLEERSLRARRGKTVQGRLTLRAYHERGDVVIEVADDGGGLDVARIHRKAVEQGLIAPGAELSPAAVHRLIFRPGFSTADRVTEISGRGVGMDVVRRNIEALGGRVDVSSIAGAGTTFAIRLPLTLAVVDGVLLRAGGEHVVQRVSNARASRLT